MRQRRKVGFLLFTLFWQLGCSSVGQSDLQDRIARAVSGRDEQVIVSMRDLTTFQWDKFYAFGPYCPSERVHEALGFEWPYEKYSVIDVQDHSVLLVFVHDGKVVHYHDHPRREGDFNELTRQGGYTPDEAVFQGKMDKFGDYFVLKERGKRSRRG